jgi:hypothetical protein
MANASVAIPTVATDRPSVLNGIKRPPLAGKLHPHATSTNEEGKGLPFHTADRFTFS